MEPGVFLILSMGAVLFMNIVVIYYKMKIGMIEDAFLDGAVLIGMGYVFGGSIMGLLIANVASMLFSIYLWFNPVDFENFGQPKKNKKNNNNCDF